MRLCMCPRPSCNQGRRCTCILLRRPTPCRSDVPRRFAAATTGRSRPEHLARSWRASIQSCTCSRSSCRGDRPCKCISQCRLAQCRSDGPHNRPPRPTVRSCMSACHCPNTGLHFPGTPPWPHPCRRRPWQRLPRSRLPRPKRSCRRFPSRRPFRRRRPGPRPRQFRLSRPTGIRPAAKEAGWGRMAAGRGRGWAG
jgi:hypothetical protein